MLVKQFNLRRNDDRGGFQSTAQSEIERPGFYRGFTAVGKTLTDVKEFERRYGCRFGRRQPGAIA